jgi:hypothetical protein
MKKKNLYIFFISLSLFGYTWLAWNIFESARNHTVPTICTFKEVTHLPCPSCGTTRSLVLLAKGYIWESVMINPFGIILAFAMIIIPFWIVVDTLRKSDSFFKLYVSAERSLMQNVWLCIPAVAIIVLNWFWNITKGL